MAEHDTSQERTEQPTPKRRQDAHKEGQVPKSQELSAAVLLITGSGVLAFTGGRTLAAYSHRLMIQDGAWLAGGGFTTAAAVSILQDVTLRTLAALLPFAGSLMIVALLVNGLQARGVLSAGPLKPKLSHISPLAGFKRLFSVQAPFNLVKSILKLTILGALTYVVLSGSWLKILSLTAQSPEHILGVTRSLGARLAFTTGLAFLLIAAADYLFQVYQHEKKLRMTKQEVVREQKEMEGDPLMKSRLRSLARSLGRKRMLNEVPDADVVVTNPTHVAVALKYDISVAPAPVIVAAGERKLAERIKAIAFAAGVPLVENKPLARALLKSGEIGKPIPPALYVAVAELIAFVYRRRAQAGSPYAGGDA